VKIRNFWQSAFPGSAEALVRLGGKVKYHLTAYFLSNISSINYQNWSMYVEVIVSQSSVVFETSDCIVAVKCIFVILYVSNYVFPEVFL